MIISHKTAVVILKKRYIDISTYLSIIYFRVSPGGLGGPGIELRLVMCTARALTFGSFVLSLWSFEIFLVIV